VASQSVLDLLERLDGKLDEDIGFALLPETILTLAEAYRSDKPNYARAAAVLRKHKTIRAVEAAVKIKACELSHIRAMGGGDEPTDVHLTRVRDIYDGAPVPVETMIPPGWRVIEPKGTSDFALIRIVQRGDTPEAIPVTRLPILVTRQFVDVRDKTAGLEVAWRPGSKWEKRTIPRERLIGAREILDALGPFGFPVTCNNARDVIQYLADVESTNRHVLPKSLCSPQLGWQGRAGAHGFLAGETHCASGGGAQIEFVGTDDGDRHAAKCVRARGDPAAWAEAVKLAVPYPRVMLAVYAAMASPLLAVLRAPGFVVDWCYKTSSGKTTALSLGASVWGCPDPVDRSSFVTSWDMTPVGFERRAATLCDLPMVVDDTKRARSYGRHSSIPGVLYEVAGGQGRVRGTVRGMDRPARWRTIMLTSGEQRAIDFDKSGGTVARVVTLWGNPFGSTTPSTADAIDGIVSGIYESYGHAGPAFVQWLVDHHDQEGAWGDRHREIWESVRRQLVDVALDGADRAALDRLAKNLAVIDLAGELAHKALNLPWVYDSPVSKIVALTMTGLESIDREIEALRYTIDVCEANRRKFLGRVSLESDDDKPAEGQEPHGGWLGYWETVPDWEWIGIYRHQLDAILVKGGYEPGAILRRWVEVGWLDAEKGRTTSRIYALEDRPRMVKICRHAAVTVGAIPDADDPKADSPAQVDMPF